MSVYDTLDERHQTYGTFKDLADIAVGLRTMITWNLIERKKNLPCDQDEALVMICTKIARVVNGDHNHVDTWRDIAGYATLVADRLEGKPK